MPPGWTKGQIEWPMFPLGFLGYMKCGELFSSQSQIILFEKFEIFGFILHKKIFRLVLQNIW